VLVPAPWLLRGSAIVFFVPVPGKRFAHSLLMLVRYREAPVGPYDELLWCRQRRFGGRKAWHVDPIVVTSEASVVSGRANWGIPKFRANMAIADRGASSSATVWDPDSNRVFADIVTTTGERGLPLRRGLVPERFVTLVQERDGQRYWFSPRAGATIKRVRVDRLSLDAPFPRLNHTQVRFAVALSDFEMNFPVATVEPL